MSDKSKFLWSAFISYGLIFFISLPIVLTVQGSKPHETSLFLMGTMIFSIPVALGVVTIGHRIFSYIKAKITFNSYVAAFAGALGVAVVLSGLANIVCFIVAGEISSDMAGLFLYPTILVSILAAIVYMGFEKWS